MADESKFGQKPGASLKCEDWETLLTDALDGLLPAGQAAAFHAHSDTCANCGDLLAHAKQGQEWLGYLHDEPEIPAGLIGKILEKTVGAGGVPLPVVAGAGVATGGGVMAMPWRRSFHETRLLMTVAMAFFSIALTLNLMGVKMGSLKLADLKPAQIGNTLSRQFYGARSSVVRYYDHLRFVYELESRTRELRRDVETQPQQQNNQQQNQQKPQKPGGSANAGRGTELRAGGEATGQRSVFSDQGSKKQDEAAEVRVSVGTGRLIFLGHSRTGLQQAVETAGYVEGSLV